MKIIKLFAISICALVLSNCSTIISIKPMPITQHKSENGAYSYSMALPENYDSKKEKYPVLVFLHGSGERGDDLNKVAIHGPLRLIREGKKLPFIVIAPQSPAGEDWNVARLDKTLSIALKKVSGDDKRIYLTGLSRGGLGVWNWAISNPNKFAAIAPISGWSNVGGACSIANVPTWVFHGEKDDVVRIFHSEDMVRVMRECGGNPVFTRYPNANHDAWTETYYNQALYDWLSSFKKP